MSFRLLCRRFLFFVRERSGLRDRMKNKKIRCESRKIIQARKKICLPLKLIYRTYLLYIGRFYNFGALQRIAWIWHLDLLWKVISVALSFIEPTLNPIFRSNKFNIFYIFGREKFSISSIRAPIKPRKFPIKPRKFPIKHLEFSTSDVFLPLYWAKKRGESLVFRALSSSLVQR